MREKGGGGVTDSGMVWNVVDGRQEVFMGRKEGALLLHHLSRICRGMELNEMILI